MHKSFLAIVASICLSIVGNAQVRGAYIETRTADVYTGQCFANGEVNLTGNEAIMGWRIDRGTWGGVSLDGTSVAAAVRAKATLGDPYADPYPATAVIIVDDQTTPAQQDALVDFVKHQGGELFSHVNTVLRQPVILEVGTGSGQGRARLQAGPAAIATRSINEHDHVCGNEYTYYQPLTPVAQAVPAVALTDSYQGSSLGETWELHGKRSAFVGSFDTAAGQSHDVAEHLHHGQ